MDLADRFEVQALQEQLALFEQQLHEANRQLRKFETTAPLAEREARALLESIPQVGPVTIDVVLSELGDWRRFRSAKAAVARHLLCMMFSMLQSGQTYRLAA